MRKALKIFFYLAAIPFVPLVLFEMEVFWIIEDWRRIGALKRKGPERKHQARRNEEYEAYDAALRSHFFLVIYLGQRVRESVGFLWKTGRKYRWHRERAIRIVARKLCRDCREAVLWLDYLRAGLGLRMQFRRAWLGDHSHLAEFWKAHFDAGYRDLEETTKRLASLLLEPALAQELAKVLESHRVPLSLPHSSAEKASNELRHLKAELWLVSPANRERLNHPIFRSVAGLGPKDWNSPHIAMIKAYTHGMLQQLPDTDREAETKELEELLEQLEQTQHGPDSLDQMIKDMIERVRE